MLLPVPDDGRELGDGLGQAGVAADGETEEGGGEGRIRVEDEGLMKQMFLRVYSGGQKGEGERDG